jgi:hypothetical protein
MVNLSAADRRIVQKELATLPPRTKAAQEKEMGEMMGKLKQVSTMTEWKHDTYWYTIAWKWYS